MDSETDALLITSQSLKSSGPERWEEIIRNVKKITESFLIELVVFEGYAFGANFHREILGEVGGILRYFFYKKKIPFGSVPPATLKKFFTGHGRADKKAMMKEAFKRGFTCKTDDEADAVALACFGHRKAFEDLRNAWRPTRKQIQLNL